MIGRMTAALSARLPTFPTPRYLRRSWDAADWACIRLPIGALVAAVVLRRLGDPARRHADARS
jgi:hypothetical protein